MTKIPKRKEKDKAKITNQKKSNYLKLRSMARQIPHLMMWKKEMMFKVILQVKLPHKFACIKRDSVYSFNINQLWMNKVQKCQTPLVLTMIKVLYKCKLSKRNTSNSKSKKSKP